MLALILGLIIGILIGWNWPQPTWAKDGQARFVALVRPADKKPD